MNLSKNPKKLEKLDKTSRDGFVKFPIENTGG